jgi:glycosyltransferase involved in cell wall biosynthesis
MELPIPGEKGAIEELIWQLGRRLEKYFNVYIYNPSTHSTSDKIIKTTKLMMDIITKGKSPLIVHSHNIYASIELSVINKYIRHILTLHYPLQPTVTGRGRKTLKILRSLDKLGTVIAAPSLHIVRYLNTRGFERVLFIPNGVDTSVFTPVKYREELRRYLLNDKEILIVNVGRIHPDKNQLLLLVALKELVYNRSYKNIKLVIIGPITGSFREKRKNNPYYQLLLRYIERYSLKEYVKFLGEVPKKEEIAQILASCDIYVHPSIVEGFPLAILEAMASGLPIIALNKPFYEGYLLHGYNALLTPEDPYLLASAIQALIEEQNLRKKLIYNALETAKHFSWNSLAKFYIKIYTKLLDVTL